MASIARASIGSLLTESDAQLIVSVNTGLAAIAANASIFATPNPTLATVQTALNAFISGINDAEVGGPEQTAIKNARRAELVSLYRLLALYVTVTCNGDMSQLLASGMPITTTGPLPPVGPLPTPTTPFAAQGPVSGTLQAKSVPVRGAGIYNWHLALASAPTVYLQTKQTTGARALFEGLTPGQTYNVQLNAVGAAGASDWSDDATMMVV